MKKIMSFLTLLSVFSWSFGQQSQTAGTEYRFGLPTAVSRYFARPAKPLALTEPQEEPVQIVTPMMEERAPRAAATSQPSTSFWNRLGWSRLGEIGREYLPEVSTEKLSRAAAGFGQLLKESGVSLTQAIGKQAKKYLPISMTMTKEEKIQYATDILNNFHELIKLIIPLVKSKSLKNFILEFELDTINKVPDLPKLTYSENVDGLQVTYSLNKLSGSNYSLRADFYEAA